MYFMSDSIVFNGSIFYLMRKHMFTLFHAQTKNVSLPLGRLTSKCSFLYFINPINTD